MQWRWIRRATGHFAPGSAKPDENTTHAGTLKQEALQNILVNGGHEAISQVVVLT